MAITVMCDETAEGAFCDLYWSKSETRPVILHITHVGQVLSLSEQNGRDDSDFYALVWDTEKGEPERIMYASTRGWSYCNGASIDATPSVVKAYTAYCKARDAADRAYYAEQVRKTPAVGKNVRVSRGNKVKIGTEGKIFWMGRDRFYRDYSSRYAPRLSDFGIYAVHDKIRGQRVGIETPDGSRVFTSASNVEVLPEAANV